MLSLISVSRVWPTDLLRLAGVLLVVSGLLWPTVAAAHPLDQYLQISYVTVAPRSIDVELDLTPGVLVAPRALTAIDTNGDNRISPAETRAFAARVRRALVLRIDGQMHPLSVTRVAMPPYLTLQAGYGTIRLFVRATLPTPLQGTHWLFYRNTYYPTATVYQVNAFIATGAAITLAPQQRDARQQSLTVAYTRHAANATTTGATARQAQPAISGGLPAQARQLAAYLQTPALSLWTLVLALGLAALLGAFHALTPGHGKTLIAAYLVGSRGTTRQAIALGGIVTFTHTASVIVLGLVVLVASGLIVPNVLVPSLDIVSGLLVVALGVRLVWSRWRDLRVPHTHAHLHVHRHEHHHRHGRVRMHGDAPDGGSPDHTHDDHSHSDDGQTYAQGAQDHVDAHDQRHDAHVHAHGDHRHVHGLPAGGFRWGTLVALAVSGGLVPCPEALGIMIIAVGLNRVVLGLGLIVSFSCGLAAVLIALGVLLVRFQPLMERLERRSTGGQRLQQILPLVSAAIVAVLGGGIVAAGVATYLV